MDNAENYLVYSNGGYREYMGPSRITKPTEGFFCGIWTEDDTGAIYFFSASNGWTKQDVGFQEGDATASTNSANTLNMAPMLGSLSLGKSAKQTVEPASGTTSESEEPAEEAEEPEVEPEVEPEEEPAAEPEIEEPEVEPETEEPQEEAEPESI